MVGLYRVLLESSVAGGVTGGLAEDALVEGFESWLGVGVNRHDPGPLLVAAPAGDPYVK